MDRPPQSKGDLELLSDLADAIGDVCRETPHEEWGRPAGFGADGAPSKQIDRKAEAAVLARLDERDARLNVLSEEAGFIDRHGSRLLVLDPIDGTTNAVKGIPFYCTSLAIGTATLGDVTVGLVRNLCNGDDFTGVRGGGARLNGDSIKPVPFDPDEAVVAPVLGKSTKHAALAVAARPLYVRGLGAAALEMCLVARGALDVYIQPMPVLRVTDIAASALILREAGGVVYDENGKDLDLSLDMDARAALSAAGDPESLRYLGVFG